MSLRSGTRFLRNPGSALGAKLLRLCLRPKSRAQASAHLTVAAAPILFITPRRHLLSSLGLNWETIESQKSADLLQAIEPFNLMGQQRDEGQHLLAIFAAKCLNILCLDTIPAPEKLGITNRLWQHVIYDDMFHTYPIVPEFIYDSISLINAEAFRDGHHHKLSYFGVPEGAYYSQ